MKKVCSVLSKRKRSVYSDGDDDGGKLNTDKRTAYQKEKENKLQILRQVEIQMNRIFVKICTYWDNQLKYITPTQP